MPITRRQWTLALLMGSVAGAARAESIEQRFRGFLDRLRGQGRQLIESRMGGLTEVRTPTITRRTDNLPVGQGEFAIFVSPGCRSCNDAMAQLRKLKIQFATLDLGSSATARQSHALLGVTGVPVILMPTQMLVGYTAAKLNEAMALDQQTQMQMPI
jgi:glutaredoxin